MTPDEFAEVLDAIGWTPHRLAQRLGIHETRTRRWAKGTYPIPENVAEWLLRLALLVESAGLPRGWYVDD
jgi:hypothetical protein